RGAGRSRARLRDGKALDRGPRAPRARADRPARPDLGSRAGTCPARVRVRPRARGGRSLLRRLRERAVNPADEPAVAVRGLEKRHGALRALAGVSFELARGTFTLASGPNGAGKSTLLRVLAALTRPTRGEVRVLGVDPFGRSGAGLRARVGYLGAEPALYADLSVEENLEFAAELRDAPRASID